MLSSIRKNLLVVHTYQDGSPTTVNLKGVNSRVKVYFSCREVKNSLVRLWEAQPMGRDQFIRKMEI